MIKTFSLILTTRNFSPLSSFSYLGKPYSFPSPSSSTLGLGGTPLDRTLSIERISKCSLIPVDFLSTQITNRMRPLTLSFPSTLASFPSSSHVKGGLLGWKIWMTGRKKITKLHRELPPFMYNFVILSFISFVQIIRPLNQK